MRSDDPRHGTVAGYQAHRKASQAACDACKRAVAQYQDRRAYELEHGSTRTVSTLGAIRRIEALMALGWGCQHIAEHMGWKDARSVHKIRAVAFMRRDTFDRLARVYDHLSARPGPSAIARGMAASRGYAPPLAWDDIDDPREQPKGITRPDSLTCSECGDSFTPPPRQTPKTCGPTCRRARRTRLNRDLRNRTNAA